MKITNLLLLFIFSMLVFLSSCSGDKKDSSSSTIVQIKKKKSVKIPVFNGDSAYAHVKKQVDFGHRITGYEGHKKTQNWLIKKFESYGAKVSIQEFKATFPNSKTEDAANIIASFNPGKNNKIIIAAHYDTRYVAEKDANLELRDKPIDGADDGGSGVGVIIELARLIKENPIDNISVDFILFDAEDNGSSSAGDKSWCLGSQYWSKEAAKVKYKADFGILLDLVGAKKAIFPKEKYSELFAKPLQDAIWELASSMGYDNLFVDIEGGGINDDHVYVNKNAKIPMVDIISLPDNNKGFGSHHHTHGDNMGNIDKNILRKTGQVVIAVLYKYSDGSFNFIK